MKMSSAPNTVSKIRFYEFGQKAPVDSRYKGTMDQAALAIPGITEGMRHLPGYAPGLGWLLPAVTGGLLGRMIPGGNETGDGQG